MGNKIMQETTPLVECSAFHRGMSVLEASLRNTEDSETIISGLLKGAAEFYGASRASVVEADWDLGIGVITYEWCKDGVPAQRDMLQCLPMEKFPRWRKALRANKPVVISDLQRLENVYPDEAAFFREYGVTILEQMLTSLQLIRNRKMLWSPDIVALNKRISDLTSQNQTLAFLKQQGLVDPDIFIAKTNELTKQLRQVKLEKEKLMDAESDMTALQTRNLIDILEGGPEFLDSFDAELFGELVEKIIIESNDSVRFCLKNGLELRESIERTVR